MGIVLHIHRGGKIHNLALEADEFRKRIVYDLVRDGEVVLTFSGKDIAGFTRTEDPAGLKSRLDNSLTRMREDLVIEQHRIRKDLEYKRMIGRAS
jgi:hypothetical protein